MNKLNIGLLGRLLIILQTTSQGLQFLILFLCPPGVGPRYRPRISSWSWPAAGTRPSARLTVWGPCGPGPSSYLTDPITQRAALWVTTSADTPQTGTHHHPSHSFKLSSDWVRPDVGGGLAAPPCGPSARCGAPDWTELLPRQAIGGRDTRAQNVYTQTTTTAAVNEAIMSRGSHVDSVLQDSVHRDTVRVDLNTFPVSKHSSSQIFFVLFKPPRGRRAGGIF